MENKDFRNDTVTITRDELASIFAIKIAHIHSDAIDLVRSKGVEPDMEMLSKIDEALLRFSADVMTDIFDEAGIGELEIEKE